VPKWLSLEQPFEGSAVRLHPSIGDIRSLAASDESTLSRRRDGGIEPLGSDHQSLDESGLLFHFCSHAVETLGAAKSLGWKVHMRCDGGYRQETRSMRRCVFRGQLDLETLVATRG